MVIADMEAGIGALLRAGGGRVDVAIVVTEPHPRSIEVARRLIAMAEENEIPRRLLVANKVHGEDDLELLRAAAGGTEPDFVVPADEAITAADFDGQAPLDRDPEAPAVRSISELALGLVESLSHHSRGTAASSP